MLILSQNKEFLIELGEYPIGIMQDGLKYQVVACTEEANILLGEYYSPQAAREVLQTIFRIYGGASKYEMPEG